MSFSPLFVGEVLVGYLSRDSSLTVFMVSVPSSSGRFSSVNTSPLVAPNGISFQSPLRRGGSRRLAFVAVPGAPVVLFQSPLRRGGSRRSVAIFCSASLGKCFSPLFVGEVLVGETCPPAHRPFVSFQSPLRRGGSRRSEKDVDLAEMAPPRFSPLFVGEVLVGMRGIAGHMDFTGFSPLFVGEVLVGDKCAAPRSAFASFQSPLRRGGSRRLNTG